MAANLLNVDEAREHLRQARENVSFAESLGTESRTQRQWACTAAFYAAVHAIQSLAPDTGSWVRPIDALRRYTHDWDQAWVRTNMADYYQAYRRLRRNSHRSRYLLFDPTPGDVASRLREARSFVEFAEKQSAR